jgi:hypothetical protein
LQKLTPSRLLRSLIAHLKSAKGSRDRAAFIDALFPKNAMAQLVLQLEDIREETSKIRGKPVVAKPKNALRTEHENTPVYALGRNPLAHIDELVRVFRTSIPPADPDPEVPPKNPSGGPRKGKK